MSIVVDHFDGVMQVTLSRPEAATSITVEMALEIAAAIDYYCADLVAERYNAAAPEATQDTKLAYARFAAGRHIRCQRGLLPE